MGKKSITIKFYKTICVKLALHKDNSAQNKVFREQGSQGPSNDETAIQT